MAEPWIQNVSFEWLRPPEVGLYLAQGRIDGSENRFNLADFTVTRCVLRTSHQTVDVGYIMGRDKFHARNVALVDGLLQVKAQQAELLDQLVTPLTFALNFRAKERADKVAESQVQFYTSQLET